MTNKNENHIYVIFGASGDLTKRKLIPALYSLFVQNLLPEKFALLGTSKTVLTDKEFRETERMMLRGEDVSNFESVNKVTDVPQGFKDWIKNNKEQSKTWVEQPQFIIDNFRGGKIKGGLLREKRNIKTELIEGLKRAFFIQ